MPDMMRLTEMRYCVSGLHRYEEEDTCMRRRIQV
jgi:hypothetical protein